jgi:hypothetical protein
MPLERFDTEAIQTPVDRKVKTTEIDETSLRTGKQRVVLKTTGGPQKNNLIKWIRGVLKLAIKKKLVKVNYAFSVEKEQVKRGGDRISTDEMWNRMVAHYPLGTKQRLTFDLAAPLEGVGAQERGIIDKYRQCFGSGA